MCHLDIFLFLFICFIDFLEILFVERRKRNASKQTVTRKYITDGIYKSFSTSRSMGIDSNCILAHILFEKYLPNGSQFGRTEHANEITKMGTYGKRQAAYIKAIGYLLNNLSTTEFGKLGIDAQMQTDWKKIVKEAKENEDIC